MAGKRKNSIFGTKLRTRVVLLIVVVFLLLALPAWYFFHRTVNHTMDTFGTMLAERQVQYDRYRGMETLNRELSLAQSFSKAPSIMAWLKNEADPDLRDRALADMDHYRKSFSDQSVFLIVDSSGNYYFNDAQNSYGHDPYSYTIRSDLERDAWYFATRERREGCYPNVNMDDVLGVTKVWINCIIAEDGQVLGLAGTGLDLSDFIQDVIDISEQGIDTMFVDQSGAIQAHRDASLVNFRSIATDIAEKTTVFSMLDTAADMALVRTMMNQVSSADWAVRTAFVSVGGKRTLVGVGYLDAIGWYNVTLMDMSALVDRKLFLPLGLFAIMVLLGSAFILAWLFDMAVIKRLERIEGGLGAMREGRRVDLAPDESPDEIGRLSRALIEMSGAIAQGRHSLEDQVRERTEELEGLVNLDDLTRIANRRGFEAAFKRFRRRAEDDKQSNGLLMIDVDNFKTINDRDGHPAGDQVIVEVARRLKLAVRASDVCARWGGDEFVVLIRNCDAEGLRKVGAALRSMMRQMPIQLIDGRRIDVAISVGAVVISHMDTLEMATDMADAALYAAKEQGRDRMVMFDPADDEPVQPATPALVQSA